MKHGAMAFVALLIAPGIASAQGFVGQVGRFYDDGGWTLYRVGMTRPFIGPLGLTYHGDYMTRAGDGEGAFAGVGLDVTAFRTGLRGPYGVVGLGGLGHMGVKLAHALGAHVVLFTTSPDKAEDARRLGADEVVISKNANEMGKHANSFDYILNSVAAPRARNMPARVTTNGGSR